MTGINFLSLDVKCPFCGKSLMDSEHKIDNANSIKMIIEIPGKKGYIRLSSIFGSYNYQVDFDVKIGEVSRFYCSHCKTELVSKDFCTACDAPMASLVLDMGGKVNFCTRKGCNNHNIGFEDLTLALKKFYQEFGLRGRQILEDLLIPPKEYVHEKTEDEENKEIIETGSFLHGYCPHCMKSLIESDMLKLKITNLNQEEGYIMLSPYLNVFSSKSTIYLPEEKDISNIKCFHCDKSLIIKNGKCERCGTAIAKILVSARTKMIDFFICSRKGCTWHGLSKKDLEEIRLEDSDEW
jgi:hypothetical protein